MILAAAVVLTALAGPLIVWLFLALDSYQMDHPRGEFSEYRSLCAPLSSFWTYLRTPWEISDRNHCWHKQDSDTYPRCCHCGKGHPDFKEKKDGSRETSSSVQGH